MMKARMHILLMVLGFCIITASGYFLDADYGYVEHYEKNLECTELQHNQSGCNQEWINTGGNVSVAIPAMGLAIGGFIYAVSLYRLLGKIFGSR